MELQVWNEGGGPHHALIVAQRHFIRLSGLAGPWARGCGAVSVAGGGAPLSVVAPVSSVSGGLGWWEGPWGGKHA
jgi:hypothetical protein